LKLSQDSGLIRSKLFMLRHKSCSMALDELSLQRNLGPDSPGLTFRSVLLCLETGLDYLTNNHSVFPFNIKNRNMVIYFQVANSNPGSLKTRLHPSLISIPLEVKGATRNLYQKFHTKIINLELIIFTKKLGSRFFGFYLTAFSRA
jgi:hypothetical protein